MDVFICGAQWSRATDQVVLFLVPVIKDKCSCILYVHVMLQFSKFEESLNHYVLYSNRSLNLALEMHVFNRIIQYPLNKNSCFNHKDMGMSHVFFSIPVFAIPVAYLSRPRPSRVQYPTSSLQDISRHKWSVTSSSGRYPTVSQWVFCGRSARWNNYCCYRCLAQSTNRPTHARVVRHAVQHEVSTGIILDTPANTAWETLSYCYNQSLWYCWLRPLHKLPQVSVG